MSIGGPAFCSGEDITLELEGFDNDPAQISEVPWIIFYNEMPLTDATLGQFVQLGDLGSTLSEWALSTSLTFTPFTSISTPSF